MKTRRLSEDQTVRWAIFVNKEDAPENVVTQIKGWGVSLSKDFNDALLFDSEKEALEMKQTLNENYPVVKEDGYVDCVMCYHDNIDPQEQLEGWINWWAEYGSSWYIDHEKPQEEKPPALRSDSELYILS